MRNVILTLGVKSDDAIVDPTFGFAEGSKIHVCDRGWMEVVTPVSDEDISIFRDSLFDNSGWHDYSYDQEQLQEAFEDWMADRFYTITVYGADYRIPYDDSRIIAKWVNFLRSDEYSTTINALDDLKSRHCEALDDYSVQDMINTIADGCNWQPDFFTAEFFISRAKKEYSLGPCFGELQAGDEVYLVNKDDLAVSLGVVVTTRIMNQDSEQIVINYRYKDTPNGTVFTIYPLYDAAWVANSYCTAHLVATSKDVLKAKIDNLMRTVEQY